MIVTSYFANWRRLVKDGFTIVSVASHSPRSFLGIRWTQVAPRYALVCSHKAGELTDTQFQERYLQQLTESVLPDYLIETLKSYELSYGKVALCCYEKPSDFCHRHILADYIKQTGINVKEYAPK